MQNTMQKPFRKHHFLAYILIISIFISVSFSALPSKDIQNVQAEESGINIVDRVSTSEFGVEGNDNSFYPSVSHDGRLIAFSSDATNLVEGDTNERMDIFVRNTETGEIKRISMGYDGSETTRDSGGSHISADGRYISFHSESSNLVVNDSGGGSDVFRYDLNTGEIILISVAMNGALRDGPSYHDRSDISSDGRFVTFYSGASNLVPGDTNFDCAWTQGHVSNQNCYDVFVRDTLLETTTRGVYCYKWLAGNWAIHLLFYLRRWEYHCLQGS